MIDVVCGCGKTLKAPAEMAGKRARCPNSTWGIYPVRFISCVALHALWTGSVALMLWHNQEVAGGELDSGEWFLGLLKVQSVPMLLHGLYDTLLKREMNALALVTAVASFGWFVFLMIKSHAADPEPDHAGLATA